MEKSIDLSAYPYVERLIADGYAESLQQLLSGDTWLAVCDEGGQLILFDKQGLHAKQILGKLERCAKELLEDGVTNDEINGVRQKIR